MTDWLSNKFRWLSLIATWAVVCIHSRTDRWAVGVEDYATRIESHVADLFHFAVPLFFVVFRAISYWLDVAIACGVRRRFPRVFAVLAGGR